MMYIATLRARRVFVRYLIVAVCLGLFDAVTTYGVMTHAHVAIRDAGVSGPPPLVSTGLVVSAAGFVALFCATFLAPGLDADYRRAAIAWTRPVSRVRQALTAFAVDGVAILAIWGCTVAFLFIAYSVPVYRHFGVVLVPGDFMGIAVVAGATAMFYALIAVGTAAWPGHGDRIVGMAWAAVLLVPLALKIPFGAPVHAIFVGLNYLDPLAYASIGTHAGSISEWSAPVRALVAAGWAALFLIVGTRLWVTREVAA